MGYLSPASDKEQVLCKTRFLTTRVLNHLQAVFAAPARGLCKVRSKKAAFRAETPGHASIISGGFPQFHNWGKTPFALPAPATSAQKSHPSQAGPAHAAQACSRIFAVLRDRDLGMRPHPHRVPGNRSLDRGTSRLQALHAERHRISFCRKTTREKGRVNFGRPGGVAA